jgi:hypothetical protein
MGRIMNILISRNWLRLVGIGILAIIVLVLAIVQPWSGPLSPDEVLAQASSIQAEIQSYRMKYSDEEAKGGMVSVAEAAYALPASYRLTLSVGDWVREYITVGETRYEKEIGTPVNLKGQVIFFSTYTPGIEATISILEQLADIEVLPDEELDGVVCYHLKGRYDTLSIEDMLTDIKSRLSDEEFKKLKEKLVMEQETTTVEYLISKDDFIIRKVQYITSKQETGIVHTQTMKFFDFNQPITIEPPLDDEGNLLPGWQTVDSHMFSQ